MKDVVRMLAATTGVLVLLTVMALQMADSEGVSLSAGDQARFLSFLLPLQYDGLNVDLLTADGKVSSL